MGRRPVIGTDFTDRGTPRWTALLLALALALGAAWYRGQGVSDTARYKLNVAGVTLHGFSGAGSLAVAITRGNEFFKDPFQTFEHARSRPPINFRERWSNLGPETRFSRHGFVLIREPSRGTVGGVLIPAGPVACGVVVFAGVRFVVWRAWGRRRGRQFAGLCPACGHEVGAFMERCPGCGRARTRGSVRVDRPQLDTFRHAA